MTTLTQVRPIRQPAPPAAVHGTCGLTLRINGTTYGVRPVDPGFAGLKAYRLTKQAATGSVYDVVETVSGIECDCADYEFRRKGLDGTAPCKHGSALAALGLLADRRPPQHAKNS